MRNLSASGTGVMLMLAAAACARKVPEPTPPPRVASAVAVEEGKGTASATDVTTMTATVESVDQKTRKVVLAMPDGQRETVVAGPEVRNLAQVKRGDQLKITYAESLAIALKKPGEATPGVTVASETERAKVGEKPGFAGAEVTTITAKIVAVDRRRQVVTLEGPQGRRVRVRVEDAARLEKVKVGDLVEATYREAIAIAVEKP